MADLINVKLEYNPAAKLLFSGEWANAALGYVARECLQASMGGGGVFHQHLTKRQSSWPSPAPSSKHDRRDRSPKQFVFTGTVAKALLKKPSDGKLLAWGGSADMHAGQKKTLRYNANGIWAWGKLGRGEMVMLVGFAGKLKHSKEFNQARKEVAVANGMTGKATQSTIRKFASVRETRARMKAKGLKGKKFAAAGALGFTVGKSGKRKMVLARGANNLAYANIVQAGPFLGIKTSKGRMFTAAQVPWASRTGRIGKNYQEVRGKRPRPLLPYDTGDVGVIQDALERGVRTCIYDLGWA